MVLAESNWHYAWSSWTPGGALLGLLILSLIIYGWSKIG
jgi:hypothetical protein